MKTAAQTTSAERVGRTLGRLWRRLMHLDRKVDGWLVAQGLAPRVAKAVLIVIKLAALCLVLYAAFWLALIAVFAVIAAWIARNTDEDDERASEPEWRYGPAGYGLYTSNEQRIDPHDSENEQ